MVAVGEGVGLTELEALADGVTDDVADGVAEAPGVHDDGGVSGEALGDGTVAAVEPAALNVFPKIPASTNAAEIVAIICLIRVLVVIMFVTLTVQVTTATNF